MRSVIALVLLTPGLLAQETFSDSDFEFSLVPPPGMVLSTPEELASAFGRPAEEFAVTPRAEAETGEVQHNFYWRDATGRDREISLLLADGAVPFTRPEQFQAASQSMGMEADGPPVPLQPPEFTAQGLRLEGTRTRGDGVALKQMATYFLMSFEPPRYAMLRAHCLEGDWNLMLPEFMDMLRSGRWPQPTAGPSGGRNARRGGAAKDRAAGGERWDTLEVTGSLVLAVVLLMGLFVGGRGAPGA